MKNFIFYINRFRLKRSHICRKQLFKIIQIIKNENVLNVAKVKKLFKYKFNLNYEHFMQMTELPSLIRGRRSVFAGSQYGFTMNGFKFFNFGSPNITLD